GSRTRPGGPRDSRRGFEVSQVLEDRLHLVQDLLPLLQQPLVLLPEPADHLGGLPDSRLELRQPFQQRFRHEIASQPLQARTSTWKRRRTASTAASRISFTSASVRV